MRVKKMFKYVGSNGVVVTDVDLPMEKVIVNRLIADDGKLITNDETTYHSVIDVENIEGFYEVDAPDEAVGDEYE